MSIDEADHLEASEECAKMADAPETVKSDSDAADGDAPESNTPEAGISSGEVEKTVANVLSDALDPIRQEVRASVESAEKAASASMKVYDLYTLMTEQRNRATLLLTKHVEMYERIKGLADLCRQTLVDDGNLSPELKSILARTGNMEKIAGRTLASFGAVPVWPERGDHFDETMHRIVTETPLTDDGDIPGTIAECLKMGLIRDGIVATAAEVVVFGAEAASQSN